MPKFIIKIEEKDTDFINNDDICCYIADEKSAKKVLALAKASDKLVLGANIDFCNAEDLDGVMIRHEVDEKFAKFIKPIQKQFKNKFMGIYCNPSRHEAMIASEAEPDFVAFDVNEKNAAEALEVMSWYAELFLIQSAVTYFEKIDKKLLDFADFVILNASDYKILVDKIKRLD